MSFSKYIVSSLALLLVVVSSVHAKAARDSGPVGNEISYEEAMNIVASLKGGPCRIKYIGQSILPLLEDNSKKVIGSEFLISSSPMNLRYASKFVMKFNPRSNFKLTESADGHKLLSFTNNRSVEVGKTVTAHLSVYGSITFYDVNGSLLMTHAEYRYKDFDQRVRLAKSLSQQVIDVALNNDTGVYTQNESHICSSEE